MVVAASTFTRLVDGEDGWSLTCCDVLELSMVWFISGRYHRDEVGTVSGLVVGQPSSMRPNDGACVSCCGGISSWRLAVKEVASSAGTDDCLAPAWYGAALWWSARRTSALVGSGLVSVE